MLLLFDSLYADGKCDRYWNRWHAIFFSFPFIIFLIVFYQMWFIFLLELENRHLWSAFFNTWKKITELSSGQGITLAFIWLTNYRLQEASDQLLFCQVQSNVDSGLNGKVMRGINRVSWSVPAFYWNTSGLWQIFRNLWNFYPKRYKKISKNKFGLWLETEELSTVVVNL